MFVLVVTALGIAVAALVKANQAHPTLRLDSSGGGGLGPTVSSPEGMEVIGSQQINTSNADLLTVFYNVSLQANLQAGGELLLEFYNKNELITGVQYVSPGPYVGPILIQVTIKNTMNWSCIALNGIAPVVQSEILDAGQHSLNLSNTMTVWGETSDGSSYTVTNYQITSSQ